jgi:hypothetical protein
MNWKVWIEIAEGFRCWNWKLSHIINAVEHRKKILSQDQSLTQRDNVLQTLWSEVIYSEINVEQPRQLWEFKMCAPFQSNQLFASK